MGMLNRDSDVALFAQLSSGSVDNTYRLVGCFGEQEPLGL